MAVNKQSRSNNNKANNKLTVPSGQTSLKFEMSGGTGDADLYVKRGALPETNSYDCRPYKSGNAETCEFTNPVAGDWFVMIQAYSSYSGLSIKGTYGGAAPPPGNVLSNGVETAAYGGASASMTCYTLSVPAGKSSLVFNQTGKTGTTGDGDLYVRLGSVPTTAVYNCRSWNTGNTETCTISNPGAGTWYACTHAYTAYTGVTMKGTF